MIDAGDLVDRDLDREQDDENRDAQVRGEDVVRRVEGHHVVARSASARVRSGM